MKLFNPIIVGLAFVSLGASVAFSAKALFRTDEILRQMHAAHGVTAGDVFTAREGETITYVCSGEYPEVEDCYMVRKGESLILDKPPFAVLVREFKKSESDSDDHRKKRK